MIGVIADDLSGAAEIGAAAWRHGLNAQLLLAGTSPAEADVVCLNTDSRSVPGSEAERRAADAVRHLRGCGVRWIYKKVDSVLRGHLVVEIRAILKELGQSTALVVPGNPGKGRTVRDGRYFIDDIPLDQTGFRQDPEYPRLSSSVLDLLGNRSDVVVRPCDAFARSESTRVVVGEAMRIEDLRCWAGRRGEFDLLSGAAEFFQALLQAEMGVVPARRTSGIAPASSGADLFVCGSVSESTRRFVDQAAHSGTAVLTLAQGNSAGVTRAVETLRVGGRLILTTSSERISDPQKSRAASRELVQFAREILRRTPVDRIYVEGGATAALLLEIMQWTDPRIVDELAPGVVRLRVGAASAPVVTLKPGSYAWPESVRTRTSAQACHAN